MVRKLTFSLLIAAMMAVYPAFSAFAKPPAAESPWLPLPYCTQTLQDGSLYVICMPQNNPAGPVPWNNELVIFAHGYVAPTIPAPWIPLDQLALVDPPLPVLVNQMGYAFAMTSYPVNGLAIQPGVASVNQLVDYFKSTRSGTKHVFLVGASEGGLVTTLAVEKSPARYSGGLALCGPVGSFRGQVDYFGDFRVVFDYYFKGIMPGTAINPGPISQAGWAALKGQIAAAMTGKPAILTQNLFNVTRVPVDGSGAVPVTETAADVLWYAYFAMTDSVNKLGGNPFDNSLRWYFGSTDDRALNNRTSGVARFSASGTALKNMLAYQTSGRLAKPLVTMHTTGDNQVPYWHETLYNARVLASGSALKHINIPILRYGHCAFEVSELLAGFALMKYMATGELEAFSTAEKTMPAQSDREKFHKLIEEHKDKNKEK